MPNPEKKRLPVPGKRKKAKSKSIQSNLPWGCISRGQSRLCPGGSGSQVRGTFLQTRLQKAACCARPGSGQELAPGTRASRHCETPRRHCIIQGMISGRMTNLGSRTPAGLVKTVGEGREESCPREAELAGLSRVWCKAR